MTHDAQRRVYVAPQGDEQGGMVPSHQPALPIRLRTVQPVTGYTCPAATPATAPSPNSTATSPTAGKETSHDHHRPTAA